MEDIDMKVWLVDVKGESGAVYGLHFEAQTREQTMRMIEDTGMKGKVKGILVMQLDLDDPDGN